MVRLCKYLMTNIYLFMIKKAEHDGRVLLYIWSVNDLKTGGDRYD